ncbi:MAG TPA: hypothetical protein VIL25_10860 [Vicinamibacterales bacterium]
MNTRPHRLVLTAAMALAAVLPGAAPSAQTNALKLHLTATAVDLSNIGRGATALVEIDIDSWSTDAQRERFIEIAMTKNQQALIEAFQDTPPKGRIRVPTVRGSDPTSIGLGWPLRYTHQTPLPDGGRRIVIATDRVMSFWERANRPLTIDYPFTLIQIEIDEDGYGEGRMAVATKITYDRNRKVLEIENFASEPVRLQNVRATEKRP